MSGSSIILDLRISQVNVIGLMKWAGESSSLILSNQFSSIHFSIGKSKRRRRINLKVDKVIEFA